jgi:site-specific DNA-methyltransferase (adenine-specific)
MNKVTVTQKDALEFLHTIRDRSIDVVVTDPPYWTLDKWRKMGTTTRLGGNRNAEDQRPEMFFETIDRDYLWNVFQELDRVLKADGHAYIFCDDQVAPILLNWIRESEDHGFEDAHMLIWDKVNQGMGYHYRRRYECIIFAYRGKRRLKDLGIPDILAAKRVVNSYPTEKPVDVLRVLISQSLSSHQTLLDPFAGSGSVAAACPDLNANILLNDKYDASLNHMRTRFSALEGLEITWPEVGNVSSPEVVAPGGETSECDSRVETVADPQPRH